MGDFHLSPELRRHVYERAQGRCEYCLFPEIPVFIRHEVDHIIARKHGGATTPENLALCCSLCNAHKGSDIASLDLQTGKIVALFHPRQDNWAEHFQLRNAEIIPLTAQSRVTVRLLQLNYPDRIEEREFVIAAGLYQAPTASQ